MIILKLILKTLSPCHGQAVSHWPPTQAPAQPQDSSCRICGR